jgi:hypothetical protein
VHCKAVVTVASEAVHLQRCEELPIPCKWCKRPVKRGNMRSHACLQKPIPCPVPSCQHTCAKNSLDAHLADPAVALVHVQALLFENKKLRDRAAKATASAALH